MSWSMDLIIFKFDQVTYALIQHTVQPAEVMADVCRDDRCFETEIRILVGKIKLLIKIDKIKLGRV